MTSLTPVQSDVLAYVKKTQRIEQMPPTRAEIAKHFGWASANAAEEHLQALARKGYIFLRRGVSRGILVL